MTFLDEPAPSAGQEKLYAEDLADDGYVWDLTRVWAHQPEAKEQLMRLFDLTADAAGLSARDKAVIVIAQAAAVGDSYCAVAWAKRLTDWSDPQTAIAALTGSDEPFSEREQALAAWARTVARSPGISTPEDIQRLRDAGFHEPQIVALTVYAGLRTAFSSINGALGARPDTALADGLDPAVRTAITWGRAPDWDDRTAHSAQIDALMPTPSTGLRVPSQFCHGGSPNSLGSTAHAKGGQ